MLKLNVKVGQSVAIGGPTTMRVEQKSGQAVALVFDADRSVPIRIIENSDAPKPRGASVVGLGRHASGDHPSLAHDVPGLTTETQP